MTEIGTAYDATRRDTDRYRSDITMAVAMATPDGASFEKLLGAEKATSGRSGEDTASSSATDRAEARESVATRGQARTEDVTQDDADASSDDTFVDEDGSETTSCRGDRTAGPGKTAAATLMGRTTLPGDGAKAALDSDAEDYARLLKRVRNTLKTVVGDGSDSAEPSGTSRMDAAIRAAIVSSAEAAASQGLEPAAALMNGATAKGQEAALLQQAAATASSQEASATLDADIRSQIASRLAAGLGGLGGKGTLKIELTPPELGRVQISFAREGDRLHLLFRVESAEAARALQDASGHLQELLGGRHGQWSQIDVAVVRDEKSDEGRQQRSQDDRDGATGEDATDEDRSEEGDKR